MQITVEQFRQIAPALIHEKAVEYLPLILAAAAEFGIDTPARFAAWVAQMMHESAQFRYDREIWGPTASQKRYEPSSKLATKLGNTEPGDGARYKGRGWLQLTGRANFRSAGLALGLDLEGEPERASAPDMAFRIAGWFWSTRGLNALADKGDFLSITRRINGGLNGLPDRVEHWERAKKVLGVIG